MYLVELYVVAPFRTVDGWSGVPKQVVTVSVPNSDIALTRTKAAVQQQ